jgi:hypothetical protein
MVRQVLSEFFDIINIIKNHEERREGPGPLIARQPALQGAKASPQGVHEAKCLKEN